MINPKIGLITTKLWSLWPRIPGIQFDKLCPILDNFRQDAKSKVNENSFCLYDVRKQNTQQFGQINSPPLLCRRACDILTLYIFSTRPVSLISRPDNMDCSHGGRRSEENPARPLSDFQLNAAEYTILPLKRPKDDTGPRTATRARVAKSQASHEDGSSYKPREPKDHGDGLNG